MTKNNSLSTGRRILDIVIQVFFWIFLAVQVFAMAILIKKLGGDIDMFPWGDGIGEDLFILLIYWFGVLFCTVLLYIFDSIGPCIISRLTYFVMFAIPFVYPFIGAPAFFYDTITVKTYTGVVTWMCVIAYALIIVDIARYLIVMMGHGKKS